MTYLDSPDHDADFQEFDGEPAGFGGFEHDELDQRLRRLQWPAPPSDVKQRVLESILATVPPPVNPIVPGRPGRSLHTVERAHRYELTRRSLQGRATTPLAAPRRQPRFGTVL